MEEQSFAPNHKPRYYLGLGAVQGLGVCLVER